MQGSIVSTTLPSGTYQKGATFDLKEVSKEMELSDQQKQMLEDVFTYHAPTPDQLPRYNVIREAAKDFATSILANTSPSADQSASLRHIREAVWTANASIALEGFESVNPPRR